jgi:hypothetical protein
MVPVAVPRLPWGYARVQRYILKGESGASLKAAGWIFDRMSLARNISGSTIFHLQQMLL